MHLKASTVNVFKTVVLVVLKRVKQKKRVKQLCINMNFNNYRHNNQLSLSAVNMA